MICMGKTIGVVSLKGGVGKTSSVVSLGSALSDFGKKVLLVDADFSSPNLGMHLNLVDPEFTLNHVLSGKANLRHAIYKHEKFDVLPASIFNRMRFSPLNLRNKLRSAKSRYDYILIDSAPSLNEEALSVLLASDEIFVVATPDASSLSSVLKSIKKAKMGGTPINGLILNKVHGKDFEVNMEDMEEVSGVPILARIPHDVNIKRAQSMFVPSNVYRPLSKASIEFKKLAAMLVGEKFKPFNVLDLFRVTPNRPEVNREVFYERVFC